MKYIRQFARVVVVVVSTPRISKEFREPVCQLAHVVVVAVRVIVVVAVGSHNVTTIIIVVVIVVGDRRCRRRVVVAVIIFVVVVVIVVVGVPSPPRHAGDQRGGVLGNAVNVSRLETDRDVQIFAPQTEPLAHRVDGRPRDNDKRRAVDVGAATLAAVCACACVI